MKHILIFLFLLPLCLASQDDLLAELDTVTVDTYKGAAFKGLKIVNFESTKMVSAKELYFVVAHRFGSIETGFEDFFGLDQAVTRLNFIYGNQLQLKTCFHGLNSRINVFIEGPIY